VAQQDKLIEKVAHLHEVKIPEPQKVQ
jgi:hypothetical protein